MNTSPRYAIRQVKGLRPCRHAKCLVDTSWRTVIIYPSGAEGMEPRCFSHTQAWAEAHGIPGPRRETRRASA